MPKRPLHGFSITETLVSVALFIILGGISFSYFGRGTQDEYYLRSVGDSIIALTKTARFRSITGQDGNAWGVHFDNGVAPFYSVFSGSYSATGTSPRYYLKGTTVFGSPAVGQTLDVIFEKTTGNLSGTSTATISVVLTRNTAKGKQVTVNQYGRVSISDL